MRIEEFGDGTVNAGGEGFHVTGDEARGGDGVSNDQAKRRGVDDIGVHGERFEGADDGHGDDGDLSLDGGVEDSAEEGLEVAVGAASALGKDDEGHSIFNGLGGGGERAQRGAGVGAVNGNLAGAAKVPSEKRETEELELGKDAELKGQSDVEDGDIEGGGVIGGVDGGLREVEAVESDDGERGRGSVKDQPGPETGEIVLDAAVGVEESGKEGDGAESTGVEVNERIAQEIRGQACR